MITWLRRWADDVRHVLDLVRSNDAKQALHDLIRSDLDRAKLQAAQGRCTRCDGSGAEPLPDDVEIDRVAPAPMTGVVTRDDRGGISIEFDPSPALLRMLLEPAGLNDDHSCWLDERGGLPPTIWRVECNTCGLVDRSYQREGALAIARDHEREHGSIPGRR